MLVEYVSMQLILDAASWETSTLATLVKEQHGDLTELTQQVKEGRIRMPRPEDGAAAIDLLESVCALAEESLESGAATGPALAKLVNVQYQCLIATLTLSRKGVPRKRTPP